MLFEHSLIDILVIGVVLTITGAAIDRVISLDWIERRRLNRAVKAVKDWPPKRPPELTVGTYLVVFSDGTTMENRFLPSEISGWAIAYNQDAARTKPCRITEIRDETGAAVWSI